MNRRRFLQACGAVSVPVALAGCSGGDGGSGGTDGAPTATARDGADGTAGGPSGTATPPPTATPTETGPVDPGRGIYVQSFQETMSMQGRAASGRYRFALMFAVPHTFWTVTGDDVSETTKEPADSLHLMAVVWDGETRTVLPETGLSVEITQEGDLVSEEVIYPMLSQPMGFHYGGNFELPGDGSYTATVSVGGTAIRRTGAFAGAFGDPASAEIPLEFTPETRDQVRSRQLDQAGQRGALRPMDGMDTPKSVLPEPDALPGTVRGQGLSDDARLVVTTLPEPPAGVDGDGTYLAVSARTRYNRYVLPAMALRGTLERDGEAVFDGPLRRTLDPDLRYHYGAVVDDVRSGDDLTLSVTTIPQVARHEGYEAAFRQMPDVQLTV